MFLFRSGLMLSVKSIVIKKKLQLTVEVPANIFRPSADKLTDVTAPSCSMKHFRIALINKSFIYIHDFKEKKKWFLSKSSSPVTKI